MNAARDYVAMSITRARTAVLMEQRDALVGELQKVNHEFGLFRYERAPLHGEREYLKGLRQRLQDMHTRKESLQDSLRAINRELRAVELEGEANRWRTFFGVARRTLPADVFDRLVAITDARIDDDARTDSKHRRQSGRPKV